MTLNLLIRKKNKRLMELKNDISTLEEEVVELKKGIQID